MTTVICILIIIAIAGIYWFKVIRKPKQGVSPSNVITLYCYNGFPLESQVLPENTYVADLGRAPRTLEECKLAGWHLISVNAIMAGSPIVIPPPFEGTFNPLGPLMLFKTSGQISNNTIVIGTWSKISAV